MGLKNKISSSKRNKLKRKQERALQKYNKRQEKLDNMYKNEKQKSDYKSLMSRLKFETYTKRLVGVVVIVSLIDLQLSYVLAFLGKDQIAESLSTQICVTLLGTILVYVIRAYFDTKAEKDNEMIKSGVVVDKKSSIIPDEIIKNKIQEVIGNSGIGEHINIEDNTTSDNSDSCG